MRQLIPTLLFFLLMSCSHDKPITDNESLKTTDSTLGIKLIAAGFLHYADSLKIDSLTVLVKESFFIYNESNNKIAHIDAEELAEFQFNFFLPRLNQILNKRNFQLVVKTADNYQTTNEVFLNGEKTQLYTRDELEKGDFWDKASRTFFKKLNDLLKKQNLNESFFLLYRGNDLHAFLLTDKQFEIIADTYKNEPKEIPYRP